ncbi:hypothetical protein ACFL57_04345 [Candidatus Margulisiibacteriota bacterium]
MADPGTNLGVSGGASPTGYTTNRLNLKSNGDVTSDSEDQVWYKSQSQEEGELSKLEDGKTGPMSVENGTGVGNGKTTIHINNNDFMQMTPEMENLIRSQIMQVPKQPINMGWGYPQSIPTCEDLQNNAIQMSPEMENLIRSQIMHVPKQPINMGGWHYPQSIPTCEDLDNTNLKEPIVPIDKGNGYPQAIPACDDDEALM